MNSNRELSYRSFSQIEAEEEKPFLILIYAVDSGANTRLSLLSAVSFPYSRETQWSICGTSSIPISSSWKAARCCYRIMKAAVQFTFAFPSYE